MSRHGVYDERGTLIFATDSELTAFGVALRRSDKLTTILLDGTREVLFAPLNSYGKRAPTALETDARRAVTQDK